MNNDDFNRAQSNYDAMTPADRREPTDEDIRLYADHIKPKLLASRADTPDLLAMGTDSLKWDNFALSINAQSYAEAYGLVKDILEETSISYAEQIASDELYGDDDHSDTLRRIGADDWRTFFANVNKERQV